MFHEEAPCLCHFLCDAGSTDEKEDQVFIDSNQCFTQDREKFSSDGGSKGYLHDFGHGIRRREQGKTERVDHRAEQPRHQVNFTSVPLLFPSSLFPPPSSLFPLPSTASKEQKHGHKHEHERAKSRPPFQSHLQRQFQELSPPPTSTLVYITLPLHPFTTPPRKLHLGQGARSHVRRHRRQEAHEENS